jgi:hypothetical protein
VRSGGKRRITRKKAPGTVQIPVAGNPLPWRNQPSDGVNHVADANGQPVYDGPDAAEMFRLYSVEAQAQRAGATGREAGRE